MNNGTVSPLDDRVCVCVCVLSRFSRVQLFVTVWTVAGQAPLSLGFSRLEYWSGLACPPPGDLPDPGIKPTSPALQADTLPPELPGKYIIILDMKRDSAILLT